MRNGKTFITFDERCRRISRERLNELRQLSRHATKGPWQAYKTGTVVDDTGLVITHAVGYLPDVAFIAKARQAIPDLLAYIEVLESENKRLQMRKREEN